MLGNSAAAHNLATCYYDGLGVEKDIDQAIKWFKIAAAKNFTPSIEMLKNLKEMAEQVYAEAEVLYNAEKYAEAIRRYHLAAEVGYAKAQYQLALLYDQGKQVKKDEKQAVAWCQKAADQNHGVAQYNLGLYYEKGFVAGKTMQDAIELFKKAARNNCTTASYKLGLCYQDGHGLDKNLSLAAAFFKKAADKGHAKAKNAYEKLLQQNPGLSRIEYGRRHLAFSPSGQTLAPARVPDAPDKKPEKHLSRFPS